MKWRIVIATVAAFLLLGGVAGAWYYHDQTSTHNVEGSSTVEFVTTDVPAGDTEAPATSAAAPGSPRQLAAWPMYGYEPDRTRAANFPDLRPPFKTLWQRKGMLVEGQYEERGEASGRKKAIDTIVQNMIEGAQSQW